MDLILAIYNGRIETRGANDEMAEAAIQSLKSPMSLFLFFIVLLLL
jgi:hypothetical protein